MRTWCGMVVGTALVFFVTVGTSAQELDPETAGYQRAVADFFRVTEDEVAILGDWGLPVPEVAVALFIADRSGVSPEALAALRKSGWGWGDLARRYHLDASHFHVPLSQDADAGPLAPAYEGYRSMEPRQWRTLNLDDQEILTLVNLRLLSQTLRTPPESILRQVGRGGSFIQVYARLVGPSLERSSAR